MQTELNQQIHEVEISMEMAEQIVKRKNDIEELMRNPLFQKIIEDGYLRDEAARLAEVSSAHALLGEVDLRQAQSDLAGIGALRRFLHVGIMQGRNAEHELIGHKEALADIEEEQRLEAEAREEEDFTPVTPV